MFRQVEKFYEATSILVYGHLPIELIHMSMEKEKDKPFLNESLPEQEREKLAKRLIQAKLGRDKQAKWQKQLEEQRLLPAVEQPMKKNRNRLWIIGSVLAAATVLLLLGIFLFRGDTEQDLVAIATEYQLDDPIPYVNQIRGSEEGQSIRAQIGEAYQAEDYKSVITYSLELVQQPFSKIDDHFYLGLAYWYDDQLDLAKEQLLKTQEMSLQENERFLVEINWFLSLIHLKKKRYSDAKLELSKIRPNQWNYESAQRLLDLIP